MSKKYDEKGQNEEAFTPDEPAEGGRAETTAEQPASANDAAAFQRQVADLTEALQRERADATNLRRQYDQRLAGAQTAAKASVVRALLPVIDNVARALQHVPEDQAGSDFAKGVQAIAKQFEKTLEQLGVHKIATVGEPFDPQYHEAVSVEAGDDNADGGREIVTEELQPGYRLGDEILRPAMVKVRAE